MFMIAVIREEECIGCTKCIQACPVDAILGSNKQMHTVITDECIGCKLCIEPCPVDCIEMQIPAENISLTTEKKTIARRRVRARKERLAKEMSANELTTLPATLSIKKRYIQQAVARVQAKSTA